MIAALLIKCAKITEGSWGEIAILRVVESKNGGSDAEASVATLAGPVPFPFVDSRVTVMEGTFEVSDGEETVAVPSHCVVDFGQRSSGLRWLAYHSGCRSRLTS